MKKGVKKVGALLFVVASMITTVGAKNKMLKAGDEAPDFCLKNQDGKKVKLSDFSGKVALYFYPMDGTPGCTKEACSLRDGRKKLKDAGITVLGINKDSVESHEKFRDKHDLKFDLLSDPKQEVAEKYGVKRSAIISWIGPKRVTFLIDDGKIVRVIKHVKLGDHADQIIEAFENAEA